MEPMRFHRVQLTQLTPDTLGDRRHHHRPLLPHAHHDRGEATMMPLHSSRLLEFRGMGMDDATRKLLTRIADETLPPAITNKMRIMARKILKDESKFSHHTITKGIT